MLIIGTYLAVFSNTLFHFYLFTTRFLPLPEAHGVIGMFMFIRHKITWYYTKWLNTSVLLNNNRQTNVIGPAIRPPDHKRALLLV